MAAQIEIKKTQADTFEVRVSEGKSETRHTVTLSPADYQRLTQGKVSAEGLIRRSFEFLLAHESKESILSRFDLTAISRYFPHYEKEIRGRL